MSKQLKRCQNKASPVVFTSATPAGTQSHERLAEGGGGGGGGWWGGKGAIRNQRKLSL